MRTKRKVWIGVVCGLLASGALHSTATAEDAPPVLKQTATIEDICTMDMTCRTQGGSLHGHTGLDKSAIKIGQQFKVNRKFFRRYARYIDLKRVWFDEAQRPDLFLIHGDKNPLSEDNFVLKTPCNSADPLDCMEVTDFPLAFGIRMLKNKDKSITPHAFVYVPARQPKESNKKLGTEFLLLILHIPDDDRDCLYARTLVERRHCQLMRNLAAKWALPNVTHQEMSDAVKAEYLLFLKDLFKGYMLDQAKLLLVPEVADPPDMPIATVEDWPRLKLDDIYEYIVGARLHNDIIHGKLQ